MKKNSGSKYNKFPFNRMTPNQKTFFGIQVIQGLSFVMIFIITWVDEEMILPDLNRWIPFASPKILTGALETIWLFLLFAFTIKYQSIIWRRIKLLEGILPICSYCKKIRDEQGKWNQMEVYVNEKTGADFSHGICPNCMQVNFGDIVGKPDKLPADTKNDLETT